VLPNLGRQTGRTHGQTDRQTRRKSDVNVAQWSRPSSRRHRRTRPWRSAQRLQLVDRRPRRTTSVIAPPPSAPARAAPTHTPADAAPPTSPVIEPAPSVKRRVTFGGLAPTSGQPSAPPSAPLSDPPERTERRASGPTRARQVALAIDACESDALLAEEKVATDNKSARALVLGCSLIALVISTTAAASLLRWNHQGLAIIAINALAIAMITSTPARHKQPRTTRTTAPPSPPLSPPPSPEERRQSVARIPTGPNLFSMTFRDGSRSRSPVCELVRRS